MAIKFHCSGCQKFLTVRDGLAGKNVKCPSCGRVVTIPAAPVAAPPAQPQVIVAQLDEPPDEDYDEEEDRPRKRRKKKLGATRRSERSGLEMSSMVMAGIGLALILLIAFTPILPWISIFFSANSEVSAMQTKISASGSSHISGMGKVSVSARVKGNVLGQSIDKEESNSADMSKKTRPEGLAFLITSIIMVSLVGIIFLVAVIRVLPKEVAEYVMMASSLLGAAWGTTVVVWMLAWVWKAITLAIEHREKVQKMKEDMAKAKEFLKEGTLEASITQFTLPSLGLWLALFAAAGVVFLFSMVGARCGRREFLLIAYAVGLAAGLIILATLVQPWDVEHLLNPQITSTSKGGPDFDFFK